MEQLEGNKMKYLKMIGKIVLILLIFLCGQFISGFIFGMGLDIFFIAKYGVAGLKGEMKNLQNCINSLSTVIEVVGGMASLPLLHLLAKKSDGGLINRCKFKKVSIKNIALAFMCAVSLAFVSVGYIIIAFNIFKVKNSSSNVIESSVTSTIGIICTVILVPAFEEILFRGFIFNELRKNLNLVLSVILQALIFAIMHFNIEQGIYVFVLGIVAALLYTWTKSILTNITFHIGFNLFGALLIPNIISTKTNAAISSVIIGLVLLITTLAFIRKNTVFTK